MVATQYRKLGVDTALDYHQIKWLKAIPQHRATGSRHRPELQQRHKKWREAKIKLTGTDALKNYAQKLLTQDYAGDKFLAH